MELLKVKDREDIVKDKKSGAILLNDIGKANEYLLKKKTLENDHRLEDEINTIKERLNDIDKVKNELADIKSLLLQIAGNGKQ